MAHRKAKLTPLGRQLLVERITELGWSVAAAAESMGVSRQTAYKWLARYRAEGTTGLSDRRSRPHRSPRQCAERLVAQILELRRGRRFGPHRIGYALQVARSTVYAVLVRAGLNRLSDIDRPTRQVVRYQRERVGELVHVDVKRLARIPQGGGHRKLGRAGQRHRGAGTERLHAAIDDHSRVAYVEVHPDERGVTCAGFLRRATAFFARMGVPVEAVMTDRALNYRRSSAFQDELAAIAARHILTPPYRPQLNGKVERFNRTLGEEWSYVRLFRSNAERLACLPDWVDTYNRRRPHTSLGGQSPMDALVKNVSGNYS